MLPLQVVVSLALAQDARSGNLSPQDLEIQKRTLTVDRIFRGEFSGGGGGLRGNWLPDGKHLLGTANNSTVRGGRDLVVIDPVTNEQTVLVSSSDLIPTGATSPVRMESFDLALDRSTLLIFNNSERVWRQNTRGDYWLFNLKSKALFKIGGNAPASSLMFAKISPDAKSVGFVRGNNIYVQNIASSKITQLTKDGTAQIVNGTFDWVHEEELDLRDGWRWSTDSKKIAYWQLDTSKEPIFTMIDNTSEKYPTIQQFPYPMAGETNASAKIGVVAATGGKTIWMDCSTTSDEGYLARMDWAYNSKELLIQRLNRLQNNLDFRIANATTGGSKSIFADSDDAYVELGKNDTGENGVRWIEGGKRFLIVSERDGWRHLYAISRDTGTAELITTGDYDVANLEEIDEETGNVFFIASPNFSTQRYLFVTNLKTKSAPRRVTPESLSGTNSYEIAPGGNIAFHSISSFGVPSIRNLISLPDHAIIKQLSDNKAAIAKLKTVDLGEHKFICLKTANGMDMDAYMITPPDFDPKKKYPIFFHVYGEPWATTVNDSWGGTDYMFHQMLAQRGYIIASIDCRGTPALKGRTFRKSIYGKLGVITSEDQVAGLNQLSELPYVDKSRVGIWGWSGGGSSTLSMLLRYPEQYHVGIAVASTPDEMIYDTIYQERYMGLPKSTPENYKNSSAINFASNLKGHLLLVHGTGDDNVHYQGVEQLMNRLIQLGKTFDVMPYPGRSHGIFEGPGTTLHLYKMIEKYLLKNLPAGGR